MGNGPGVIVMKKILALLLALLMLAFSCCSAEILPAEEILDAGDSVSRGQQIGVASGGELYYEYRLNGESVEPGTGDDR